MGSTEDIKSMGTAELAERFRSFSLPSYRAKQVSTWVWKRGVESFEEMSDLPKPLRDNLAGTFHISRLHISQRRDSRDGSRKYLLTLSDGSAVECVGIPSFGKDSLTVCVSTQVGCPMGCVFCATGRSGFTRNLTVGEIVDQVHLVGSDFGARIGRVVVMGQGEPFLNYKATLSALEIINDSSLLGVGARHITVSTCGIVDGIERFTHEPAQYTLAVSLHSAIQATRDQLMPSLRNHPLSALRESLKRYGDFTKRRPSLEYTPLADINDTDEHINALVDFCHGMLSHVNLIRFNAISGNTELGPSPRFTEFEQILRDRGLEVSARRSRGEDIEGACGQLKELMAR